MKICILFVSKGAIDKNSALAQVAAWIRQINIFVIEPHWAEIQPKSDTLISKA